MTKDIQIFLESFLNNLEKGICKNILLESALIHIEREGHIDGALLKFYSLRYGIEQYALAGIINEWEKCMFQHKNIEAQISTLEKKTK